MSIKQIQLKTLLGLSIIIIGFSIAGCSAGGGIWGDPESGLILSYRMEKDVNYSYSLKNNTEQDLDIMGQKMKTSVLTEIDYTLMNKKTEEENLNLDVTINGMNISITTPQGEMKPDVSQIAGKSFGMMLSKLGYEFNFQNIDKIKYKSIEGDERNISSHFEMLLPNLSSSPVKIGESWESTDTMNVDEGGLIMKMIFNSVNRLTGIEEAKGYECARIISEINGTLSGGGEQRGMKFTLSADLKGTDNWLFAYKEGLFVKSVYNGSGDGNIVGTQMTIPLTMKINIVNDLK